MLIFFCFFRYIAPEQVPVQYGGLSKENDTDFTTADAVTEVTIKPASKHTIEIPATEVKDLFLLNSASSLYCIFSSLRMFSDTH